MTMTLGSSNTILIWSMRATKNHDYEYKNTRKRQQRARFEAQRLERESHVVIALRKDDRREGVIRRSNCCSVTVDRGLPSGINHLTYDQNTFGRSCDVHFKIVEAPRGPDDSWLDCLEGRRRRGQF